MQRGVDLVFADIVGQGVHDLPALLVPDVRLALHQGQRRFVADFAGAAAQIAVQKMAQHLAHVVLAVFLLHHHVGGILRQRFRHHVRALHLAADQLVAPPLMAELVRGDEVSQVDIVFVAPCGR